jgi:hypothetical protein
MKGRRGKRHRKLLDDLKGKEKILSFEGGSFRSQDGRVCFGRGLDLS